ncbi:MAG: hypothetical protein HY293_04665 [Planctomycetes bacterium]|nr:hypothetical protein [Planctomycetota bacterium]
MSAWLIAGCLWMQSESLDSDRIEDRAKAAARFECLARDLADAAGLWTAAFPSADAASRLRLTRLRESWRSALAGLLPPPPEPGRKRASLRDLDEQEDRQILRRLRTCRLTLDANQAPLTAVVDEFREKSGLNFHITGVENPEALTISFKSGEQPLEAILRQLLRSYDLAYLVRDGVVLITSVKNIRDRVRLEQYDVQDLVTENGAEDLIERIVRKVHSGEWKEESGRSIRFKDGLLVVRNINEVQEDLQEFLRRLRTGEPEELAWTPGGSVVGLYRHLPGPDGDEAEQQLALIGKVLAEAIETLALLENGRDLEASLRASALRRRLIHALGGERIRRLLEADELRSAVREFRSVWDSYRGFDDFDGLVRHAFGSHARSARFVPQAVLDPVLITKQVGLQLWSGDAALIVREGRPCPATMKEWQDPQGGTLIFTLPQELGERKAGEGPACVVVELAR